MEFCKHCGSILVPTKQKGKVILVCSSCGYKQQGSDLKLVEKTAAAKRVTAVDTPATNTLPVTEVECPACGNDKAYFRSEQTRAADEPETLFFTCTKCGKTWREYE